MSQQLQLRRGTAAQIAAFTGAPGEVVVDTTNNRLVVGDGSTAGGFPAAKLSEIGSTARVAVADASYSALTADRLIVFTALTAARTVSLPTAASYPTGTRLTILDESGACSSAKTIAVNRAGTDLIDGATSFVIEAAYGGLEMESNGANAWTILSPKPNLQASLIGAGTPPDPNNVVSAYGASALFNGASFNVTVNKSAAANTASFIFEDGFSGRAQIGLCGDDNFHFKVSPDGAGWIDALALNSANGTATFGGGVLSRGAGGVGYAAGAGGAVAQASSKSTAVALNASVGQVTMNAASLAPGAIVSFTLNNSAIAAGDLLVLNHVAGGTPGAYTLNGQCAAGAATINVRNAAAGALAEAIVVAFAVIKGATS